MTKVTIDELALLFNSWIAAGNDILVDEAGGFNAYSLT